MDGQAVLNEIRAAGLDATYAVEQDRIDIVPADEAQAKLTDAMREHITANREALVWAIRLNRGAEVLFDYERRGMADTDEYRRLFGVWLNLLCAYEIRTKEEVTA